MASCFSDKLLAPKVPHLNLEGFSISCDFCNSFPRSSKTCKNTLFWSCDLCLERYFQQLRRCAVTCRQPVLRAYSPRATNLAVPGIHLHDFHRLQQLAINKFLLLVGFKLQRCTYLVSCIVTVKLFCRSSKILGLDCASMTPTIRTSEVPSRAPVLFDHF